MPFSFRRLVFGKPIRSEHAAHARLPIVLALPIFASDALSSVAYATETILRQFGTMHIRQEQYPAAIGISMAIIGLIAMVVFSYKQVIYAYDQGGGSYIVAKENLGLLMGLIAASALLVDYVLTVAVSIADCVAQSGSALHSVGGFWADLFENKMLVAIVLVCIITLANLRGVRESGALFAGPSYGFIVVILTMIGYGVFRISMGASPVDTVAMLPDDSATTSLDWLLLLRGFASGCAALTGIEAVSNGVQAFKKPEARNAFVTLAILGCLLAVMFIGITYLAVRFKIGPSEQETVVSQIARAVFGKEMPGGIMYYAVQLFTSLILFLAANTAFAGFPRLASILAEDGFLPRQLANLGERLAYNNGILVLGILASLFLIVFKGEAHALLPLYTIGVFIAFTTAQAGMVRRSWNMTPRPYFGLVINALGALVTFVVLCVVTASKFIVREQHTLFGIPGLYEGAWMAIVLMALVVFMFRAINRHYVVTDKQLAVIPDNYNDPVKHTVIVLVPGRLHKGVMQALNYARSISPDALGVHISFDEEREKKLRDAWNTYGGDTALLVLNSPYRSLIGPLMKYIDAAERVREDDIVTVVVPEFVPTKWWHNVLHNASGWLIRLRLYYRKDIVFVSVRYYLDE
jgi:amino acid transporter